VRTILKLDTGTPDRAEAQWRQREHHLAMLSSQMGTIFIDEDEWTSGLYLRTEEAKHLATSKPPGRRDKHLRIGVQFAVVQSYTKRAGWE
jgi:hypothetical protein